MKNTKKKKKSPARAKKPAAREIVIEAERPSAGIGESVPVVEEISPAVEEIAPVIEEAAPTAEAIPEAAEEPVSVPYTEPEPEKPRKGFEISESMARSIWFAEAGIAVITAFAAIIVAVIH